MCSPHDGGIQPLQYLAAFHLCVARGLEHASRHRSDHCVSKRFQRGTQRIGFKSMRFLRMNLPRPLRPLSTEHVAADCRTDGLTSRLAAPTHCVSVERSICAQFTHECFSRTRWITLK
jgi:hypothetical protein